MKSLWRQDRRETAPARRAPEQPEDMGLWSLYVLASAANRSVEWRLAQLSRRQNAGAPRAYLRHVSLIGPIGACIAPGDPHGPGAAWGQFDKPDLANGGAKIVFEAEMKDATDFETLRSPFPGADYARMQFFVRPPKVLPGEPALALEIEIDGSEVDGRNRAFRLRLKSTPLA